MVRVFLFDYFTIPSDSMTPTLELGSKVIVNKMIMGPRIYTDFSFDKNGQELRAVRLKGLRPLRHNDIVVFNYPLHHDRISFVINHVYCKRIIGLPGDSVSAVDGHLRCNNFDGVLGCAKKQEQLESKDERTLRKYGVYRVAPRDSAFNWNIKDWGPLYVPRKDDVINITPYTASLYRKVLEWETGNKVTWNWNTGKVIPATTSFLDTDSCIITIICVVTMHWIPLIHATGDLYRKSILLELFGWLLTKKVILNGIAIIKDSKS